MKEQEQYYYKYVISQLRRVFNFDANPRKRAAWLAAAAKQIGTYYCAGCPAVLPRHKLALDHIEPIIPVTGFDNWSAVFKRHFHGELQVLCKEKCHAAKTKREAGVRAHHRRLEKEKIKKG
jgi:hypothetical protein